MHVVYLRAPFLGHYLLLLTYCISYWNTTKDLIMYLYFIKQQCDIKFDLCCWLILEFKFVAENFSHNVNKCQQFYQRYNKAVEWDHTLSPLRCSEWTIYFTGISAVTNGQGISRLAVTGSEWWTHTFAWPRITAGEMIASMNRIPVWVKVTILVARSQGTKIIVGWRLYNNVRQGRWWRGELTLRQVSFLHVVDHSSCIEGLLLEQRCKLIFSVANKWHRPCGPMALST